MVVGCLDVDIGCTPVVGYSAVVGACQRVDMCLHACGQQQYGLANQGLIFSLVFLYYFKSVTVFDWLSVCTCFAWVLA